MLAHVHRAIHIVVVWSQAIGMSAEILDDLSEHFVVREVFRVTWTPERFASNLSRLYGDTLPPGSAKEIESGNGPFLLAVVEDPAPRIGRRRTTRGFRRVNVNVLAARRRYRRLTGGGYRVHATLDARETAKDLFLIVGRRPEEYAQAWATPGDVVDFHADLLGTGGWADEFQLLQAIEVCGGYVALGGVGEPDVPLVLLAGDRWWAERIAQGTVDPEPDRRIVIAGSPRRLDLHGVGDGSLVADMQQALLRTARRNERGILVRSDEDAEAYVRAHRRRTFRHRARH